MTKAPKSPWFKHPTKQQMLLSTVAWLMGSVLLVLSMTNFFTESLFRPKYAILIVLLIGATLTEIGVVSNYYKNGNT